MTDLSNVLYICEIVKNGSPHDEKKRTATMVGIVSNAGAHRPSVADENVMLIPKLSGCSFPHILIHVQTATFRSFAS